MRTSRFPSWQKFLPFYSWRRDVAEYASLREKLNSPVDDSSSGEENYEVTISKPPNRLWNAYIILFLLITNVLLVFALVNAKGISHDIVAGHTNYVPQSWAHVDTLPTKWTRFNWWTEFSDKNFTETDAAWDAMNTAHGFIAMDREWALSEHWPDSMHLPSDDSKNVYLLEAYHLLHCIKVVRTTFYEALRHENKYTFNPPHSGHCLDMIRQYIICKADNTPLYLFGDDTAGDEQYRKCNDWDSLRDYATDNTACYRDTPSGADRTTFTLGEHFGYCDDGYDGVKAGERRGNWEHGAVFDGNHP